jgi:hypothetical protein
VVSKSSLADIAITDISWCPSYRIIPAVYPSIEIFENISHPDDLEALLQIEAMTDDIARQMNGNLRFIDRKDIITGKGSGRIMPCFFILDLEPPGKRFSNNEFGAYYAAHELETSIKETIFHREKFLLETSSPAQEIDNILVLADIKGHMHDIRGKQKTHAKVYQKNNYTYSRALAKKLKENGSSGITYDSVRNPGGQCTALFNPHAISHCRDSSIFTYIWDGKQITGYYKKSDFATI